MKEFFEIKCMRKEDQRKIWEEIEKIISDKKKEGTFSEKEIREIEEMRLSPLLDIQDVQSVYENFMYRKKEKINKSGNSYPE